MKKQQVEYKVNIIGERDLLKVTKEELELLATAFIKILKERKL